MVGTGEGINQICFRVLFFDKTKRLERVCSAHLSNQNLPGEATATSSEPAARVRLTLDMPKCCVHL